MVNYFIDGLKVEGGKNKYDIADGVYDDIIFRLEGVSICAEQSELIKLKAFRREFVAVNIIDGEISICFDAMLTFVTELDGGLSLYGQSVNKVEVLIGGYDEQTNTKD